MTDPLLDLARLEGVPSAVQSARDAVDAVLRDRGLRQTSTEQRAAARLASARATARLEDLTDPGADVDPDPEADPDAGQERWLPGSLRLYAELTELAGSIRTTPPQVFARAHALLARGVIPDAGLGRLRDDPGVAARISGLSALLTARSEAPVVVLAAVAHGELATVSPFGSGDGVLARAVEHLILIEAGVDPPAVLVPEAGHLAAGAGYRAALAGYANGSASGVRDWLLHCAAALTRGAEESPVRR